MKDRILILLILLSGSLMAQDPGTPGGLATTRQAYDLGDQAFKPTTFPHSVEVKGWVTHPTDLSGGPHPIIMILHGRHFTCYDPNFPANPSYDWPCKSGDNEIPNYQGYEYLADFMASHDYIVISIAANGISSRDNNYNDRGMPARGELLQHHLDLWNTWNTAGGGPFSGQFVGKLDLSNIGTLGHSRGGEGVIDHVNLNRQQGEPYGIRAVLSMAPVNFNRPQMTNIPYAVMLPYCDGDIASLHGVHFYDDFRYTEPNDTAALHSMLFMGANHNYFNTVWTPGMFAAGTADDWDRLGNNADMDPHCGLNNRSNKRFDPAKQRALGIAYVAAFFRRYIGNETQFDPILKVEDRTPPASSTLAEDEVFISYHSPAKYRLDVNRTDTENAEIANFLTGAASQNNLEIYDICGDDAREVNCLNVDTDQQPHTKSSSNSNKLGLSQLMVGWDSSTDHYENQLPANYQDLTQFKAFQFRAAVNFQDGPQGVTPDFSVQLIDGGGGMRSELVSDHSKALFFPPGTYNNYLPRILHNTIRMPLSSFTGVDLTDVRAIRFAFDRTASGAIIVSDLTLHSDDPVQILPMADFTADVTTTSTGVVQFTDLSLNGPEQWLWEFDDGSTSDQEDPLHAYMSTGTYPATLTVKNPSGKDR